MPLLLLCRQPLLLEQERATSLVAPTAVDPYQSRLLPFLATNVVPLTDTCHHYRVSSHPLLFLPSSPSSSVLSSPSSSALLPLVAATYHCSSPSFHLKHRCHPPAATVVALICCLQPIRDQRRCHSPCRCCCRSHLLPSTLSKINDAASRTQQHRYPSIAVATSPTTAVATPINCHHCTNAFPLPLLDVTIAAAAFPFPLSTARRTPLLPLPTNSCIYWLPMLLPTAT
ncbi:hypothetical protein GW17_00052261 [Ensete ventricosum]|nr:hypothetical protein GW17_00052261 [Ensete ventricosum]